MFVYMYVYVCVCMYVCMYIRMYVGVHMVCVCVCVCVYFIFIQVICRTAHVHTGGPQPHAPQQHATVPLVFMLPALSQLVSDENILRSLLLVQGHVAV